MCEPLDRKCLLPQNHIYDTTGFHLSALKLKLTLVCLLPIPGEAKAKAMPGRLYIHTK